MRKDPAHIEQSSLAFSKSLAGKEARFEVDVNSGVWKAIRRGSAASGRKKSAQAPRS